MKFMGSRWLDIFTIIILISSLSYSTYLFREVLPDDAFITFRYAKNIALGRGFCYNIGEPIQGTSSPFYTFLLAAFYFINPNLPIVSLVLGSIALFFSSFIIYLIFKSLNLRFCGLIAAFLTAISPVVLEALVMETPFVLLWWSLAIYEYLKSRYLSSFIFVGLLIFTRLDGIILAILLIIFYLIEYRKIPWLPIACALFIFLPWLVISKIYFGSWLPNSVLVKMHQGEQTPTFWHTISSGGAHLIEYYYSMHLLFSIPAIFYIFFKKKKYLIFPVWFLAYFLIYSLFKAPGIYPWYYAPLIPPVIILSSLGAGLPFVAFLGKRKEDKIIAISMSVILFVILIIPVGEVYYNKSLNRPNIRLLVYKDMVEWINTHTNTNQTIACNDIGIIGYYCDHHIFDFNSLVNPELKPIPLYKSTEEDLKLWFEYFIDRCHPDIVITQYAPRHKVFRLNFYQSYELTATFFQSKRCSEYGCPSIYLKKNSLSENRDKALSYDKVSIILSQPQDPMELLALAESLQKLNLNKKALEYARKALKLAPNQPLVTERYQNLINEINKLNSNP